METSKIIPASAAKSKLLRQLTNEQRQTKATTAADDENNYINTIRQHELLLLGNRPTLRLGM